MLRYVVAAVLAVAVYGKGDPEANMKAPEIIAHWGYPVETVTVYTDDDYELTMHRIPHGKDQQAGKRPVMFLQHGLEASSSNWITNLPGLALGFMAADAGFDVWMGNVRGDEYSLGHKTLDHKKNEYWKFSWDEMVKYDLPAMINKALTETGQDHLYYVGHSQGTLIMLSYLSQNEDFNSKIRQFHALAPVGTVKHIQGLLAFIANNFMIELEAFHSIFGDGAFLPQDSFIKLAEKLFCSNDVTEKLLCGNLLWLIAGPESHQMNTTRLPVYIADMPGGTSTQNVLHWCQMVKSGKQQMYDFGSEKLNKQHYGQTTPPLYDVSKITVPTYLYWSDADWLADKKDITDHLLPNLQKNTLIENNYFDDFNHLDFIWGQRAASEIYTPLIEKALRDVNGQKSN
ncbi:unnamed protein product, partial [Mesorhabditis belari]|uniref:Lipase n=1 Tax=Mesorhabditis belari TaxID=2138241 RepID=A0AAF3J344_9BILA